MKKMSCMILVAVLTVALLTACGGNNTPAGTEDHDNGAPAATENLDNSAPAATEDLDNSAPDSGTTENQTEAEPECKEDDFVTESLGDGTCKLTAYIGGSGVVVIPESIRGETVIEIDGVGTMGITKVVLPDTVEIIGFRAFNCCMDLEEIVFGKGLKQVDYFAFNACDSLTELVFPEGMTTLSEMPLGICANLKEIYIPASVTEFGGRLFYAENMPDLVVVTPAGSAAEQRAQEDGLTVRNP